MVPKPVQGREHGPGPRAPGCLRQGQEHRCRNPFQSRLPAVGPDEVRLSGLGVASRRGGPELRQGRGGRQPHVRRLPEGTPEEGHGRGYSGRPSRRGQAAGKSCEEGQRHCRKRHRRRIGAFFEVLQPPARGRNRGLHHEGPGHQYPPDRLRQYQQPARNREAADHRGRVAAGYPGGEEGRGLFHLPRHLRAEPDRYAGRYFPHLHGSQYRHPDCHKPGGEKRGRDDYPLLRGEKQGRGPGHLGKDHADSRHYRHQADHGLIFL